MVDCRLAESCQVQMGGAIREVEVRIHHCFHALVVRCHPKQQRRYEAPTEVQVHCGPGHGVAAMVPQRALLQDDFGG